MYQNWTKNKSVTRQQLTITQLQASDFGHAHTYWMWRCLILSIGAHLFGLQITSIFEIIWIRKQNNSCFYLGSKSTTGNYRLLLRTSTNQELKFYLRDFVGLPWRHKLSITDLMKIIYLSQVIGRSLLIFFNVLQCWNG